MVKKREKEKFNIFLRYNFQAKNLICLRIKKLSEILKIILKEKKKKKLKKIFLINFIKIYPIISYQWLIFHFLIFVNKKEYCCYCKFIGNFLINIIQENKKKIFYSKKNFWENQKIHNHFFYSMILGFIKLIFKMKSLKFIIKKKLININYLNKNFREFLKMKKLNKLFFADEKLLKNLKKKGMLSPLNIKNPILFFQKREKYKIFKNKLLNYSRFFSVFFYSLEKNI
jgi:hypothetical protein